MFSNVSFEYTEGMPVLKNINITLKKGKKYAIIGASGSGKSTLIKLLSANYGGFDGKVYYRFSQKGMKQYISNTEKLFC